MTATLAVTHPSVTRRPAAGRIALWALQVLLAAAYVFAAWGKVTLEPMTVAGFDAMGLGARGAVTIGVLELLGAVALLVPRLAGLAAWAFVALMIGATVFSAAFLGFSPLLLMPVVTLALVTVVAVARRQEVPELLRALRRHPWARRS